MPIKNMCDLCDATYFTHKLMALLNAYESHPTYDLIDKMVECVHVVDMLDEDVWQMVNKRHYDTLVEARRLIKKHYK
jgi:hypothetical protein